MYAILQQFYMQFMVTFSIQLTTSSLYKLAIHRAIFCPMLHHQNWLMTSLPLVTTAYKFCQLKKQGFIHDFELVGGEEGGENRIVGSVRMHAYLH